MRRLPQRQGAALFAAIALAAVIAACLLSISGCGDGYGAEDALSLAQATRVEATQPITDAQLEGCFVEEFSAHRTGKPVRGLSVDSCLRGSTASDQDSVLVLKVPALRAITLRNLAIIT